MKEVNQVLRNKIIKLIHKELDEVGGKNIFHSARLSGFNYIEKPVYTISVITKSNIDESIREVYKCLQYTLAFEDGEPSITISTSVDSKETEEPYKTVWTWLGRRKLVTAYTECTVVARIVCGHIYFDLTEQERVTLVEKTELAWEKYLSLKDEVLDNDVMDKIDMRLKGKK